MLQEATASEPLTIEVRIGGQRTILQHRLWPACASHHWGKYVLNAVRHRRRSMLCSGAGPETVTVRTRGGASVPGFVARGPFHGLLAKCCCTRRVHVCYSG